MWRQRYLAISGSTRVISSLIRAARWVALRDHWWMNMFLLAPALGDPQALWLNYCAILDKSSQRQLHGQPSTIKFPLCWCLWVLKSLVVSSTKHIQFFVTAFGSRSPLMCDISDRALVLRNSQRRDTHTQSAHSQTQSAQSYLDLITQHICRVNVKKTVIISSLSESDKDNRGYGCNSQSWEFSKARTTDLNRSYFAKTVVIY